MKPCPDNTPGCLAYNLKGVHEEGGRHVFTVNARLRLQAGEDITIGGTPGMRWDILHTTVDTVDPDTQAFTVTDEPPFGLGSCDKYNDDPGGCGRVDMTPYTPNFTLAEERNGQIGEDFSY